MPCVEEADSLGVGALSLALSTKDPDEFRLPPDELLDKDVVEDASPLDE
jgi:hypothetical protein